MQEVAEDTTSVVCGICDHDCATYRKLKRHYKKTHPELKLLCCLFCAYVTTDEREIMKHKKVEHRNDRINCSRCEFSTRSWTKWRSHENSVHETEDVVEDRDNQQETQVLEETGDCQQKNLEYSEHEMQTLQVTGDSQKKKDRHTAQQTEDPEQKNHVCGSPPRKKRRKSKQRVENSDLQEGDNYHSEETTEKATKLISQSYSESEPGHLSDSALQENCDDDTKKYVCSQCDKSYKNASSLSRHQEEHKCIKPYTCSFCNFTTKSPSSLKSHANLHADVSPFHCLLCDKMFSKKISLTYHMRTHSGDKPFHCPYCEYSATQKSCLAQHVRNHVGSKPFKCDVCDYSTSYSSNLSYHAVKHSIERPFSCEFCKKSFKRKDHLQNHIQRKHEDML